MKPVTASVEKRDTVTVRDDGGHTVSVCKDGRSGLFTLSVQSGSEDASCRSFFYFIYRQGWTLAYRTARTIVKGRGIAQMHGLTHSVLIGVSIASEHREGRRRKASS